MIPKCILVHPVGTTCNIACSYCFHRETDMKDMSRKMKAETFLNFFSQWVSLIPEHQQCDVVWHGGEPTLRGIDFYREVLSHCMKIIPKNKLVGFSMQTNGVSISDNWINLFEEYNVKIGVSIDGPKEIHNSQRIDRKAKGTFTKTMKTYERMQARNISAGVVIVINKANVTKPDEIFSFMLENNIKRLQLSPCLEINDASDGYSVDINDFSTFICRLYDLLLLENNSELSVGFIEDIIKYKLGFQHDNCMLNDTCGNFLVLDWNGDIKTCDGFGKRQQTIGHTLNKSLIDYSFLNDWSKYHKQISNTRTENCSDCEWYKICHGGCPYHWPESGIVKTEFCSAHKKIFSHISTSMDGIFEGA